jgi:PilZ domain
VVGDVGPSVYHSWRDHNNVARLHDDFLHVIRHSSTCRPVWSSRKVIAVLPSVDNIAVGEHRSAARDDVITFGLEVVNDAPRRPARRRGSHLAPAGLGRRSRRAPDQTVSDALQSIGNFPVSERRAYQRQRVLFSCAELGEDNGGIILNISEGGLALQAVAELVGDELPKMRFQFSHAQSWMEAKGRIAWRSDSKKDAGVEFIDLSAATRMHIRAWISSTNDESEFQETPASVERAESTFSIPAAEPKILGRVPGKVSYAIVSPPALSYANAKYEPEATKHEHASASHKRLQVVGLLLAAVLFVSFVVFERHHFPRIKYGPQRSEVLSSEKSPMPPPKGSVNPEPASNPNPTSNIPGFVLHRADRVMRFTSASSPSKTAR